MDSSTFLIYVVGFLAIFWFFLINPQRKKMKQQQELIRSLDVGDKVTSLGGIYGTIAGVKDRSFLVQVADGVVIEMSKQSIAGIRYDDDEDTDDEDAEDETGPEEEFEETGSKSDKE